GSTRRTSSSSLTSKSLERFNYAGLLSTLFYLGVFLAIGLPIWYRTTTPERWPLPDVSQLMVRSQTLTHYYKISVVFLEDPSATSKEEIETSRLRAWLQNNHPRRQSLDGSLSFTNDWTVRAAFEKELKVFAEVASSKSLEALDEAFGDEPDTRPQPNSIVFYVLPQSVKEKTSSLITSGHYRALYIDLQHLPKPNEDEGENVHSLLGEAINRQVEAIQSVAEQFYAAQAGQDHDQDVSLLMGRNFDLIFDVIYEDEEEEEAIEGGKPFLEARRDRHQRLTATIDQLIGSFYRRHQQFASYFHVNFISQVLHYVLPGDFISSRLVAKPANGTSTSKEDQRLLPLSSAHAMLDYIEARRVEHDNEKSYHVVLYVASNRAKGSLQFYDAASDAKSNLLTTPFRGAILILNGGEGQAAAEDLFTGFRQLMRGFFRLSDSQQHQLETEAVVHALVQKHILRTLSSLESTEKLLRKVSNMVIERAIAQRIHRSLDESMRAAELLGGNGESSGGSGGGDLLRKAYALSCSAYSLAEQAFFDPSLLSLLYFPDDQKYAIYLPLFLPICLPILTNSRIFYRYWLHRKQLKAKMD
ncbi:hypothetical protein TYRP_009265, partial [Tyrophagus putrescentiae]